MTDSTNSVDARTKIKEIYTKAAGLFKRMDDSERLEDLAPMYNRVEMGLFRLVVMGEIKKGKSSFINALLGENELLPVASDVATSTVFKIIYGPEKKLKVFFYPDVDTGKRSAPKVISADEIEAYGTETGNPKNKKKVDFIGVELPHPLLKNGLVIVDTPGVGGLYREHRDITLRYAPNADAIFFVVDSVESVISNDEILFLDELMKTSSERVVFIQSKIDAADEEGWKAWQKRNQSILSEKLGLPIEKQLYFPISAKIKAVADRKKSGKHLERSGYLDLLNYLNHKLIPSKENALAKDAASVFRSCLLDVARLQKKSVVLLQETSKEALVGMQTQLAEKRRTMAEWQSTTFQTEVQAFTSQLNDLKRSTRNRLQDELEPTGPLVSELVETLRNDDEISATDIAENVKGYQQDLLMRVAESTTNIHTSFNRQFRELAFQTLEHLGSSYESEVIETDRDVQIEEMMMQDSLNMHFSGFESTRTRLYGGMAGTMIAGFIATLVFPPAGIAALLTVIGGGLVGGSLAGKDEKIRKKNEALQRLQQVLQVMAHKTLRHSLNQFDETTLKLEREASDAFRKSSERMKSEVEKEIQDVQEAVADTKESSMKKLKETSEMLEETTRLLSELEMLIKAKT